MSDGTPQQYDEEKLQADTEERELLVTKPKEDSEKARKMHTFATDESGQSVQKWKYLDNFYKRYNKVIIMKEGLSLSHLSGFFLLYFDIFLRSPGIFALHCSYASPQIPSFTYP